MYPITHKITIDDIHSIISQDMQIALSDDVKEAIIASRNFLDKQLTETTSPIYGINTGFGSLYNTKILDDQLGQLQKNLMMSHACGFGNEVPHDIVRMMILLKIQSLSYGYSGVQLETVELLVEFFNRQIIPVVYEQGSLGASGDLAPLAHLCLPLIGLGEVYFEGQKYPAHHILERSGLKPISLRSKEGLALLNGTQFMSAYGTWCLIQAKRIMEWSTTIAAVSLEAFDGRIDAFHPSIHRIRPHKGQVEVARQMRKLLGDSMLSKAPKAHVQDPYSFRCIPQVHGASFDAINSVAEIFETEINSVTDNPNIIIEDDLIVSGGNFHGQTLAIHLDFLCIALSELANISERRTYKLISGERGLPPYLVQDAGLNSGFMIPQYTAASIVSQNKQLCTPASVDSIVSSNGQEDHVSMGANAAVKCKLVVDNVDKVLAIELFTAAQAVEFRDMEQTSMAVRELVLKYREFVPSIINDQVMQPLMERTLEFLKSQ